MYNIENLIKLRDKLKDNEEFVQEHLNFDRYYMRGTSLSLRLKDLVPIDKFNECDTTCCLVGFAAALNVIDTTNLESFWHVSNAFMDGEPGYYDDDAWAFLFQEDWPNDLSQALKRIDYAIEHNSYHPDFFDEEASHDYGFTI